MLQNPHVAVPTSAHPVGVGAGTLLVVGFCFSLHITACGPLQSAYLIVAARAELEGAKAAHADEFAPYEYTAASLYLDQAEEQQGYAQFGIAIDYAYKAHRFAKLGKKAATSRRDTLRNNEGSKPIKRDDDGSQKKPSGTEKKSNGLKIDDDALVPNSKAPPKPSGQ